MTNDPENVSQLLQQWRAGDEAAADRVLAITYQELRKIARGMMRGERENHTLQATALVHEAYLRLFQDDPVGVGSRPAFLRLMASQMKRHLIDHARRRRADKRGGGQPHAAIENIDVPAVDPGEDAEAFLERLDDAVAKLTVEHPRVAEIVRFRIFENRSIEETAKFLGVASGTIKRDYAFGRVWLRRELGPVA
jgi:RNA polymerase sigma factor (TIGR02999 family)